MRLAILHQAADLRLKTGELRPQETIQLVHMRLETDKQFANPKAEGVCGPGVARGHSRWTLGGFPEMANQ